jgi:WD40 repeat protein
MRRLCTCLIAFLSFMASQGPAQEPKSAVPPRFDPLAKNERFRLRRVLGMPELPPAFEQTSAISADGKWAIYAEDLSSGDVDKPKLRTRLLLFDLQTKSWPREFDIDGKTVDAVDFSRDGSKVLLSGNLITPPAVQKGPVHVRACLVLLDLRSGKPICSVESKEKYFRCVALAPDGTSALAVSSSKFERWDLKQGKLVATFDDPLLGGIKALAFLPGGKQFLGAVGGARLWNVGAVKPAADFVFEGSPEAMRPALSKDGKRFAAAAPNRTVLVWDIAAGNEVARLAADKRPGDEFFAGLATSEDGKTVVAAWEKANQAADDLASGRLVAWDVETKKMLWSKAVAYRGRVPMLIHEGKLLVGGGANLFETWNIKDGTLLESWGGHKGPVSAIAMLPNGDLLSGGPEGALLTWRNGQVKSRLPAHQGAITALAMSRDRTHWLTAGGDKIVKLWSADKQKPIREFKGHTGPVTSLAFSKESTWAASGSGDRTIKTWNLATGKEIATIADHSESVNAVAISPDERWIASASDDAAIRLWPVKAGKLDPDRDQIILEGHKKSVLCLAFSADGKTLLSGSQDQTVKVWDWAKEKAIRTITGHKNWITAIEWVDADTFLTTSDDLSLCWWELATGKEVGRIDFGSVSDCPRCLARVGPDRLLVGTSSWLIYEFQMLPPAKSKAAKESSSR